MQKKKYNNNSNNERKRCRRKTNTNFRLPVNREIYVFAILPAILKPRRWTITVIELRLFVVDRIVRRVDARPWQ